MNTTSHFVDILNNSPSVEILRKRNRDFILPFLIRTFGEDEQFVSKEVLNMKLIDYLDATVEDEDTSDLQTVFEPLENKAKRKIKEWTDQGFLSNYLNEEGVVIYELSQYTLKTITWVDSLKKTEFVGTESKFKNVYDQLKQLVEYTDEDVKTRISILEDRKLEIQHQIDKLTLGEEVEVYDDTQIISRFDQLLKTAKELLSDFKEVEDNFKAITKDIYVRNASDNLPKKDILDSTFNALDEMKESHQGKSFYAFWRFLLDDNYQEEWGRLTETLFVKLKEKDLSVTDTFLKNLKQNLNNSALRVTKANDKMSEKLTRIIRDNNAKERELTHKLIGSIKTKLAQISWEKDLATIGITIETSPDLNFPIEKGISFEEKEQIVYTKKPELQEGDFTKSEELTKIFANKGVDRKILRNRIQNVLNNKGQSTIHEIVELNGGLEKGLPELFGYIGVLKNFSHSYNSQIEHRIVFDKKMNKSIKIPEIIIVK